MAHETEWFRPDPRLERAHQRCFWRRVGAFAWALAIVAIIAAVVFLAGCAAVPEASKSGYDGPPMIAKGRNGDYVRLTKDACPNTSGWLVMSSARMIYQGKEYRACWFMMGQYIIVVDSNGDASAIPAEAFRPEEAV